LTGLGDSSVFSAAVEVLKFPPTAFPKGKPLQKNLDTHYVNLEALFRSLAQEGFGGTVLMVFEEGTEVLIVFRDGTIITSYSFGGSKQSGLAALSHGLRLAKEHKAYVDVFKMEHEMLVAMLPLVHGVQVRADSSSQNLDGMLKEFRKAEFTGSVVVGENVPEMVGLIYGGVPMGWFDAQGTEHETGSEPAKTRSQTVRAFVLDGADTFAAVNLALDKLAVAAKIRDLLFGELKELGLVLYARGLEDRNITDEKTANKGDFLGLVDYVERAANTLRSAARARHLAADLRGVVDTMIDVGF